MVCTHVFMKKHNTTLQFKMMSLLFSNMTQTQAGHYNTQFYKFTFQMLNTSNLHKPKHFKYYQYITDNKHSSYNPFNSS